MKFDWLKIKSCVIPRDAENGTNTIRFTARNVAETERNSAHAAIIHVILSGLVECNLVIASRLYHSSAPAHVSEICAMWSPMSPLGWAYVTFCKTKKNELQSNPLYGHPLIRTLLNYGQFSLSLGKALIFSLKFNSLNTDTPLMRTTGTSFLPNQQLLIESQP